MTDRETALAQLETIEDAYTRWMLARAVGCPDMEHRDAQALSSALFAMFDGGPEADDEPCAIKRALRPEAQGVRERKHDIAAEVFKAMLWSGEQPAPPPDLSYTRYGNSNAEYQARAAADRILSALDRPEAQDGVANNIHREIMNLPCDPPRHASDNWGGGYKLGHRDARHAAAEMVLRALSQGGN